MGSIKHTWAESSKKVLLGMGYQRNSRHYVHPRSMDRRPFHCVQFLGGLKLLKLGNFLLKMIPVLEGLKPLLPRLTSLL